VIRLAGLVLVRAPVTIRVWVVALSTALWQTGTQSRIWLRPPFANPQPALPRRRSL
ncbi:hypothetical protein A2U01_0116981, partial [Trifolium medium]|nr:hypothetical protein [Trifolium medium]